MKDVSGNSLTQREKERSEWENLFIGGITQNKQEHKDDDDADTDATDTGDAVNEK